MTENSVNILICCTGSVATIQLPLLIKSLLDFNKTSECKVQIRVVMTKCACHFVDISEVNDNVKVYLDEEEWSTWTKRGDPVLHIDLGKWADILVIAPLDANTLAKLSTGICDNLLTCIARAWDINKPLLFCPAMNTRMWDHPFTGQQITVLKKLGYVEVPCISKTLMCGDIGLGAMAEVQTIVQEIIKVLNIK